MRSFTPLRVPLNVVNLQTVVRELARDLLKYVSVTVTVDGNTTFDHLLNRQPLGWFVVDKTALADVARVAWDTKTITLTSTSPVECQILIF